MGPELILGVLVALVVSAVAAPAGVSGAVFLVPFQVSVLGSAGPVVTATNLLYNVIATPGALVAFRRRKGLLSPLTKALVTGTVPGVIVGAVIRAQLLSGTEVFYLVIALVLGPLGLWLLAGSSGTPRLASGIKSIGFITIAAAVVGVIGGIYGIGGGSILGPILVASGFSVRDVAPAALASTFAASVVGLGTFLLLGAASTVGVTPDWSLGVALGVGGLAGAFIGASLQGRLPEVWVRRLLGAIAIVLAARYALLAVM